MQRKASEIVSRMATIAILAALGLVLMAYAKFPYPLMPFLEIEFSDTVVLVAYALYGFSGAIAVAIFKTLMNLLILGPVGFYGIGQITAFLASMTYILGLFLCSHVFKWFKKGIFWRILSYVFITILVSVVMTGLNLLFITPTFVVQTRFSTCFDPEAIQAVEGYFSKFGSSYFTMVVAVYMPFNLLKGALVTAVYEIIFNRLIFVLMARSPKMQKYFLGPIIVKKSKEGEKGKASEEEQSDNKLVKEEKKDDDGGLLSKLSSEEKDNKKD
ncbi:MAG: ECF transporter S component [Bacilli bacterium]|jgi:riboflavin transporter FmnP|nr:ECF transporter S component [Bacilli bacterium]